LADSCKFRDGVDDYVKKITMILFFFGFRTGFRPTKDGRLICLVCRGMRTGQALFPLGMEPGIPQIRPSKELLATEAQATWLITMILINNEMTFFSYEMMFYKI
jgi:hypothetical protein